MLMFEVDKDAINPKANFRETLDLDSLDYVDLVVFVEENFSVKLTANDFQTVKSFDDFYNFTGWDVGELKALEEVYNFDEYKYLAFSKDGSQGCIELNS